MKAHQVLAIGMVLILLASFANVAAKGEIPISTNSKAALEQYLGGREKLENAERSNAATYFDRAIELDPGFALAYLGSALTAGNANLFRKNLEKAVKLASQVTDGEKHLILYYQAAADRLGDKQQKHLEQLLRLFPSDKRVQQIAGFYYGNSGEYTKALKHLEKAVAIDKEFAPAYNNLGYCHMALKNFEAAEQAFKTYISLLPEQPNPYDSYAELMLKQGNYKTSIEYYQKALEQDPEFLNPYKGIGHNYIFLGDFTKAREYYQQAYDKSPQINGKLNALFWKRVSYLHEGDVPKAIEAIVDSRQLGKNENLVTNVIGSYFQEAFILTENRQLAEAIRRLETGMKMLQTAEIADAVRENMRINGKMTQLNLMIAQNELDSAMVQADGCFKVAQYRNNPNELKRLNSLMGILEMKQGNYSRSLDYFSQSDQDDPYNWFYMAALHEKMNDAEKAMELTQKISKHNENSLGLALVRQKAQTKQKEMPAKAMK